MNNTFYTFPRLHLSALGVCEAPSDRGFLCECEYEPQSASPPQRALETKPELLDDMMQWMTDEYTDGKSRAAGN